MPNVGQTISIYKQTMNFHEKRIVIASIWIGISLITLIIAFCLLVSIGPERADELIYEELVLTQSSKRLMDWIHPHPTFVKFYFFNVTNRDHMTSYIKDNLEPSFAECGPYVYEEIYEKTKLTWKNDGKLTYVPKYTYHFRRDLSVGSDEDYLVILNALIVAVAKTYTKDWNWWDFKKTKFNSPAGQYFNRGREYWENHQVIVPRLKVKDIIWGHKNNILSLLRDYIGVPVEQFPEQDGIIVFTGKNNTERGEFQIYTGEEHISHLGIIARWNKQNKLNLWKSDKCDTVFGSDGHTFPPNIKPDVKLSIFEPDLCRRLFLDYKEDRLHKDLPVYRFEMSKSYFNPNAPENDCYCKKTDPSHPCGVKGTFEVSNCKNGYKGWPLVYSKPHFLHSDHSVREDLPAMKPDETLHETYFDIVPKLGITVASKLRLQVNLLIGLGFNHFYRNRKPYYSSVKPGIYPLFWFERGHDTMPDEKMDKLKSILNWPFVLRWGIGGSMLAVSFISAIYSLFVFFSLGSQASHFYRGPKPRSTPVHFDADTNTMCVMED